MIRLQKDLYRFQFSSLISAFGHAERDPTGYPVTHLKLVLDKLHAATDETVSSKQIRIGTHANN